VEVNKLKEQIKKKERECDLQINASKEEFEKFRKDIG